MKLNGRLILFTLVLVAMTTACKFFLGPNYDWSGFTPIFAIVLFAGMIVKKKNASFLLPLLALFISDAVIEVLYRNELFDYAGFYSGQWKNYAILLFTTFIGWMLKGKNYGSIAAGAVVAPTLFFLISNFMVWTGAEVIYTRDFNGLMTCYAAGLPFYKNALIATVVFLPVILFSYNYISKQETRLTLV